MQLQLEIRHLKLVKAIAEEGTVSRAADCLYLTQSALSHQLRDVERKLGVPLFLRLKKRMVLTLAGERLLQSAEKLLSELKNVEAEVRQLGLQDSGVLRVSTECYTCYHWLPPLLKTFNGQLPHVAVQIVVQATRRPVAALLEGKIDLAIVSSKVRDSRLSVEPLFEDELVAVVSPTHRFSARSYLRAEDFSEENLFTYNLPVSENAVYQKFLVPRMVKPRVVSPIELTEAIIELVKANLGIAVLARWAVKPQLEKNDLIALRLGKKGLLRTWRAVTRKGDFETKANRHFIRLLSQQVN